MKSIIGKKTIIYTVKNTIKNTSKIQPYEVNTMRTPFYHIFDDESVGQIINPLPLNQILKWAVSENLPPQDEAEPKVLFLGIDVQMDFMDSGSLGVTGSKQDVINMSKFLYNNIKKISSLMVSVDTHEPMQIFHPCWWIDAEGNHPAPFTIIKPIDLTEGKYKAVKDPALSKNYVRQLEKAGKELCIWPYHCLNGTLGHALENQFSNLIHFVSLAKNIPLKKIQKGQSPLSEMYGIFRPEYSTSNDTNTDLLEEIASFDKIVIAGEAKSHCVLESVKQFCEYFYDKPEITRKLYILTDCMSDIAGYEKKSETAYNILVSKYKINLVKSTDSFLD